MVVDVSGLLLCCCCAVVMLLFCGCCAVAMLLLFVTRFSCRDHSVFVSNGGVLVLLHVVGPLRHLVADGRDGP